LIELQKEVLDEIVKKIRRN